MCVFFSFHSVPGSCSFDFCSFLPRSDRAIGITSTAVYSFTFNVTFSFYVPCSSLSVLIFLFAFFNALCFLCFSQCWLLFCYCQRTTHAAHNDLSKIFKRLVRLYRCCKPMLYLLCLCVYHLWLLSSSFFGLFFWLLPCLCGAHRLAFSIDFFLVRCFLLEMLPEERRDIFYQIHDNNARARESVRSIEGKKGNESNG